MHQLKDDNGYTYSIHTKLYFGANCETLGMFATNDSTVVRESDYYPHIVIDTCQPMFHCSDSSYMIPILDGHGGHWYQQAWNINHPKWNKQDEIKKYIISQEDVVAELIIAILVKTELGVNLKTVKSKIKSDDEIAVHEIINVLRKHQARYNE